MTFACTIPDLWPYSVISNCFYQHGWKKHFRFNFCNMSKIKKLVIFPLVSDLVGKNAHSLQLIFFENQSRSALLSSNWRTINWPPQRDPGWVTNLYDHAPPFQMYHSQKPGFTSPRNSPKGHRQRHSPRYWKYSRSLQNVFVKIRVKTQ